MNTERSWTAELTWNDETKQVSSVIGTVYNLMSDEYQNIKPDEKTETILKESTVLADKIKKQVIGSCITPLLHGDRLEKTKLTLLGAFATILKEKKPSDICLLSWGTWRSSLPPSKKPEK